MKMKLKWESTEKGQVLLHHLLKMLWPVQIYGDFSPYHSHGGEQAKQTEHMVTMQVGNKNMMDPGRI